MADLVNKFHIQDAIDSLEKRYPEVFQDLSRPLSADVPLNDPSFVAIRQFLAQIKLNDRYFDERKHTISRIRSGIEHYQTIAEIARKMQVDTAIVNEQLKANPALEIMYLRKQRERDMVVMTNTKTGEQKVFSSLHNAAEYIHVGQAVLKKALRNIRNSKPVNGWIITKLVRRRERLWNG